MGRSGKIRAIGLISGGLDSLIAARLIQEQGIEVIGMTFSTPFWDCRKAIIIGERAGIPMKVVNIEDEHFAMVKRPVYGYGSNMNPCIDCHALMIRKAGEALQEMSASFIFTGEVVGQRPMSQRREALKIVERLSGYEGKVLRPLSARLLPETDPEKQGIVDRSRLLAIGGRGRKKQMELAKYYGIKEYDTPGGGCLLTKEGYSNKLKTLLALFPDADVRHAKILKHGRLFVVQGKFCFVVGRHADDNMALINLVSKTDVLFSCRGIPGPVGILLNSENDFPKDAVQEAALILASLSDAKHGTQIEVSMQHLDSLHLMEIPVVDRNRFNAALIR